MNDFNNRISINLNLLFTGTTILILLVATMICATPFIGIEELIHPTRIDSIFLKVQEENIMKNAGKGQEMPPNSSKIYYNPIGMKMKYEEMDVRTRDGLILSGWFIRSDDENKLTLLVIHDLNESRITNLDIAKGFNERGYSIFLYDQRAHGTSEGNISTLGVREREDVEVCMDTILSRDPGTQIILLGIGMGADIAIDVCSIDKRPAALVLQSPYLKLSGYVEHFAQNHYGIMYGLLYPMARRELEKRLGYHIDSLDYGKNISVLRLPIYFIGGTKDEEAPFDDLTKLYANCPSEAKENRVVPGANHFNLQEMLGDDYFDNIALFIVHHLQRTVRNAGTRKITSNDLEGIYIKHH